MLFNHLCLKFTLHFYLLCTFYTLFCLPANSIWSNTQLQFSSLLYICWPIHCTDHCPLVNCWSKFGFHFMVGRFVVVSFYWLSPLLSFLAFPSLSLFFFFLCVVTGDVSLGFFSLDSLPQLFQVVGCEIGKHSFLLSFCSTNIVNVSALHWGKKLQKNKTKQLPSHFFPKRPSCRRASHLACSNFSATLTAANHLGLYTSFNSKIFINFPFPLIFFLFSSSIKLQLWCDFKNRNKEKLSPPP